MALNQRQKRAIQDYLDHSDQALAELKDIATTGNVTASADRLKALCAAQNKARDALLLILPQLDYKTGKYLHDASRDMVYAANRLSTHVRDFGDAMTRQSLDGKLHETERVFRDRMFRMGRLVGR